MAPTLSTVQETRGMKPEAGDLIEIFQTSHQLSHQLSHQHSHQHWAVYVGDDFIVHLGPPYYANSMPPAIGEMAIVKKEKLLVVVGRDTWKVNNSRDMQHQPRPAHVIVREACEMVGRKLPHCVTTCERFAIELRYGKAVSRQVRLV